MRTYLLLYIWPKMLSSSPNVLLKVSETTFPQNLFPSECITVYKDRRTKHFPLEYTQDYSYLKITSIDILTSRLLIPDYNVILFFKVQGFTTASMKLSHIRTLKGWGSQLIKALNIERVGLKSTIRAIYFLI